jgi:hypothetical protein
MDPHRNISLSLMARRMKISRDTLRREMRANNIDHKFSNISNADLDKLVKSFKDQNPESGTSYVIGFLRSNGLRIQRQRVRLSIRHVDQLGQTLWQQKCKKTHRRPYHVSRPNALWHLDGHHKLIMWGIVIHGCVDGYSHAVCCQAWLQVLLFLQQSCIIMITLPGHWTASKH